MMRSNDVVHDLLLTVRKSVRIHGRCARVSVAHMYDHETIILRTRVMLNGYRYTIDRFEITKWYAPVWRPARAKS